MKIKYIFVCLLANICLANAQYQNFNITTTNDDADSKSYIGRDYVRLQNGYSFSAKGGKTLNAKVQSGLNNDEVNTFLNFSTTTESDAITTIDKSKAIGQIPISSSVSPSGAKCYNVPIEVVSGRQGFQPNLTLAYNSQGDNGKVGIGWNISGLSSIERVNKNVFYDGKNDIPAFTTDDVFALDGIRLIRTSSTLTTITYETVTNNIKVTAYVSGNYFQYFKVMYPNGALAIYGYENGQDYLPLIGLSGNIDNSGIDKSKPTWLSYPITKSLDINSNVITYKYAIGVNISGLDNGFLMPYYIYEINYGKNGSINDFAKISFEYKTRKDIILYQQCGYYGMLRNILSGIKVYVGTNNIRTYQLDYNNQDPRLSKTDTENRFDVNRLIQINCNVGNELLNPLKFKYGTNNTVLTVEKDLTTLGSSNFDMKKINFSRGKLDANLRNDALIIYPKKNVYQKGSDGSYTNSYLNNEMIDIYTDLSGSNSIPIPMQTEAGFADILSAKIDNKLTEKIVKINTSLEMQAQVMENITFNIYDISLGPINHKTYSIYVAPSYVYDSNGFLNYSITPRKNFTGNFTGNGKVEILSLPLNLTDASNTHYNKKTYLFDLTGNGSNPYKGDFIQKDKSDSIYALDLDGDGQTEIACITSAGTDLYKYSASAGFSNYGHISLSLNDIQYRQMFFSDLNNDGKTDIILSPLYNSGEWKIYYSDGKQSFFSVTGIFKIRTDQKYYIQDVDDDNLPELIVNDNNNLALYPLNNHLYLPFFDGDHPIALGPVPKNSEILLFDINSSSKDYQVLVLDSVEVSKIHFSQSHGLNNQISLMINSLGIADKTNYDQLYQGKNYTPGTTADFPNTDFQGALWVTTQNSTLYNKQLISNTTYNYTGAILHKQGLGLRGFTTMKATDLMTNKVATTEFDPYKMGAIKKQTSDTEESTFDYTFTDFSNATDGNKKMKLLLNSKTVTDNMKGNTATVTCSGYDGYGNVGTEITNFSGDIINKSTIENTWDNKVNGTICNYSAPLS